MGAIIKHEKLNASKGKHKNKQKAKLLAKEPELQEDFVLNPSDDRFSAVHTDHRFALDPSSSQFRKSQTMTGLLSRHRRNHSPSDGGQPKSKKRRVK